MFDSAVHRLSGEPDANVANDNSDAPWPVISFSTEELAQLVRLAILDPAPSSPVALLLQGRPPGEADSPSVTASLEQKGMPASASGEPVSELGALLLISLRVLARPRARLTLARHCPEGEPSILPLFLSGELAVAAFLDDSGLHLGMPMERSVLSRTLEEQLAGEEPPPAGGRLLLPASVLATVEALWCATGRSFSQAIPRDVAELVLAELPDLGAEPATGIAELVGSGIARDGGDGLRFTAGARPWMERVLSGHSCELSYMPLDPDPAPSARPLRLLFLGPAGRRILCSGLDGLDGLDAVLGHGPEGGVVPGPWTAPPAGLPDSTLTLSCLPRSVLCWHLHRLIQA